MISGFEIKFLGIHITQTSVFILLSRENSICTSVDGLCMFIGTCIIIIKRFAMVHNTRCWNVAFHLFLTKYELRREEMGGASQEDQETKLKKPSVIRTNDIKSSR